MIDRSIKLAAKGSESVPQRQALPFLAGWEGGESVSEDGVRQASGIGWGSCAAASAEKVGTSQLFRHRHRVGIGGNGENDGQ